MYSARRNPIPVASKTPTATMGTWSGARSALLEDTAMPDHDVPSVPSDRDTPTPFPLGRNRVSLLVAWADEP